MSTTGVFPPRSAVGIGNTKFSHHCDGRRRRRRRPLVQSFSAPEDLRRRTYLLDLSCPVPVPNVPSVASGHSGPRPRRLDDGGRVARARWLFERLSPMTQRPSQRHLVCLLRVIIAERWRRRCQCDNGTPRRLFARPHVRRIATMTPRRALSLAADDDEH